VYQLLQTCARYDHFECIAVWHTPLYALVRMRLHQAALVPVSIQQLAAHAAMQRVDWRTTIA
jgi:hypothetical protein